MTVPQSRTPPVHRALTRHARAARPFIIGCAVLGVLTAVLLLAQADLLATAISQSFLDGFGLGALTVVAGLLGVVVLARAGVSWLSETMAHRASARVLAQLRAALIDHVLRTGPRRRAGHSPADLAALATRGVDRLDGYFSRYLPQLLVAAVVPAVVGVRILVADWVAAVIVAVTVPLIPVFMVLIGWYTEREVGRQWRTLAVLGNHFLDLVAGLATLTAFGRARAQLRSLRAASEAHRKQTMRTLRVAFLSALALELLATLSVALIAVSIGLRLVSGTLDLHTALVVLILAPEVYLPLRAVGARFHDSAEGVAAAGEIFALLEEKPTVGGTRSPAPNPSRVPLRVEGVTVNGRSGPVLDALSLRVEPGEVLGITGPSGAGKSTLLDLLLGWYPPDAGHVYVDGVNLAELDRAAWQERLAWVPQRPRLLAGDIASNIRLGRPHATDAQVTRAARAAGLDLPLTTEVGELGDGLSTGQQRRVALARALVLDRPLLLLDEPTEGVDAETEVAIVERLPAILDGKTAVIVTHREAVLDACDRVVSLVAADRVPDEEAVPATVPGERHADLSPTASIVTNPTTATAETGPRKQSGCRPSPPTFGRIGKSAPRIAPVLEGRLPQVRGWLAGATRGRRRRLALACLLSAAALGCGVALTGTSAWLISAAALHPPVLSLMVAIVAVRAFGLSKGVLRYLERLVSHDVALRALSDLRVRVWAALVRLGPATTGRLHQGDLLSRLMSDVDSQQDLLLRVLVPVAGAGMVALGTAATLGVLLPEAGLIVLFGLFCAGVLAPMLSAMTSRRAERETARLRAKVSADTVELLAASPELIAFGADQRRHVLLRRDGEALSRQLARSAAARGAGAGAGTLAIGATMLGCLLAGIAALRSGRLPGPELAVLALTPLATGELVTALPEAAQRLLGARVAAHRLAELDAGTTPSTEPERPLVPETAHGLRAEDLSVRWPGATDDTVRGLNLTVRPGHGVVLTGPSGAGKSTALAALMRYLDPSGGRVLLDDADTQGYRGDDVREQLAWCGPRSHLFDSTLRENLLLARPSATDDDLRAALGRARLDGWLARLPDGLDTALGAHGTAVSGGERQRIGVARALLADRPILLLDEPTAHLDAVTAASLARDLRALTAGRAALIVTHRPAEFGEFPSIRLGPRAREAASMPGRE
ncbi:thiol reductant ABC exporter subunit CydD [Amycolatopsis pigmentata]|uniref:Thiol reductant ABC exporter subunit CydD n=1 Tax=Amycolatopsis pigmentata TaxID=450801 RepID=A0ABW5FZ17_9PSEU